MSDVSVLFQPLTIGGYVVPNRVLMAPLTRNRAHSDGTPLPLAVEYYRQRASAGLIVSEATQISAMGKGYLNTPGIYEQTHVDAWKKITDAVHAGGGRIFCQLLHAGRIGHVSLSPEGRQPLSSTNQRANAKTYTAEGFTDCSSPEAMSTKQIQHTINDFSIAAKQALAAGFDGIEIHGANGYLIDQFLQDGVNDRTDEYGGSIKKRLRFLEEVFDAVLNVWCHTRVGLRLSPLGEANDMSDSDPKAHFSAIYASAKERGLAYLHVIEQFPGSKPETDKRLLLLGLREQYDGVYIANGGFDAHSAADAINDARVDAVAFGRPFIANPDLPERYRTGATLNEPNADTFYGGAHEGYTDYPFLDRHITS